MLECRVRERQSGKTTEVIAWLRVYPQAIAIIPYAVTRGQYPDDVRNRIITYNELMAGMLHGRNFHKIYIDEGFLESKVAIAKLYHYLGRNFGNIETISYGTV
jgi:hypothetical protein